MENTTTARHFLSTENAHTPRSMIWRRRTWAAWVALTRGHGRHRKSDRS